MEILQSVFLFLQDQILGMKWLNSLIGNLLSLVGLCKSQYKNVGKMEYKNVGFSTYSSAV